MQNVATSSEINTRLPVGVRIVPLVTHSDDRGELTEIFRQSWVPGMTVCQWNCVRSEAGVLRGMHAHLKHEDYLFLAAGSCVYGLFDCRRGSPTEFLSARIEASQDAPFALVIPTGVAHGFYFRTASLHMYSVTQYWDRNDELGCRYDDLDLGIEWPSARVRLSARDEKLSSLRALLELIPPWKPDASSRRAQLS